MATVKNESKAVTLDQLLNSAINPGIISSTVLQEAIKARNAERNARVLEHATQALAIGEAAVANAVSNLRHIRNAEREAKRQKDNVVRAVSYFNETGNYFPLIRLVQGSGAAYREMRELGVDTDCKFDAASLIPEGWEPANAVTVSE